jgi:hypothetical protein
MLHIKWLLRVLIGLLTGKSNALFTSKLVNNAFQKVSAIVSANLVAKIDEILRKIVPRKRKKHKKL